MSQRHAGTEPGTISAVFPSLRAARSARERLSRAGFARNSIDIDRDDDAFVVSIATRDENRARAERILDAHPVASDLREAGSRAVEALQGNRPLALGLAALAGFALYGLTNRR
jgi:hypothetical protein